MNISIAKSEFGNKYIKTKIKNWSKILISLFRFHKMRTSIVHFQQVSNPFSGWNFFIFTLAFSVYIYTLECCKNQWNDKKREKKWQHNCCANINGHITIYTSEPRSYCIGWHQIQWPLVKLFIINSYCCAKLRRYKFIYCSVIKFDYNICSFPTRSPGNDKFLIIVSETLFVEMN